jgi:hypothetical protein
MGVHDLIAAEQPVGRSVGSNLLRALITAPSWPGEPRQFRRAGVRFGACAENPVIYELLKRGV